jgi:predicted metal-dependent hydrolase
MKKCSSSGDYPLNHSESQDLPPYECRRSKRAQRLHIRVFPTGKVEVVLPQGCSKKRGQALVRERVDWIERALQKMASRKASIDTNFPLTLDFFAINETWEILRESDSHPTQIRLREKGRSLILSGATAQDTLCLNVLKKWLIQKGKKEQLPQRVF